MENLKKEELIEGEVYTINSSLHPHWLYKPNKIKHAGKGIWMAGAAYYTDMCNFSEDFKNLGKDVTFNIASDENKHWLNTSIQANKFIPKEEALKSFNKQPESKYIIGKWYKSNCSGDVYYSKIKNIDDSSIKCEQIAYGRYCDSTTFQINSNVCKNNILLDNLEEIQQYLSEGHIDKIVKSKNMFVKDDYIVLTKGPTDSSYKINFCYKQRGDCSYLLTYLDSRNSDTNGWSVYDFNKTKELGGIKIDWRYATKEEIAEYDKLGKPYDVTTLNKSTELTSLPEKWCIKGSQELKNIGFSKWKGSNKYAGDAKGQYYYFDGRKIIDYGESKNGYPEITLEQFKKWVLKDTVEELKSLVGRYVKILKDSTEYGGHKYLRLRSGLNTGADKGNYLTYELSSYVINIPFRLSRNELEIMPEGFTPDKVETMKTKEPKFKKGDKVKVCNKEQDAQGIGFKYDGGRKERISGVAGDLFEITEYHYDGGIYYTFKKGSSNFIHEDCLSLVESVIEDTWIPRIGNWITIENSSKLENGCTGCPSGTWQVVDQVNNAGLASLRSGTFNISIEDKRIWRISTQGCRKALPHEIPSESKLYIEPTEIDYTKWSKEDLLEEAKRRYPVGTICCPVHLSNKGNQFEISGGYKWDHKDGYIYVDVTNKDWYTPIIYNHYTNKWSEIISKPSTYTDTTSKSTGGQIYREYSSPDYIGKTIIKDIPPAFRDLSKPTRGWWEAFVDSCSLFPELVSMSGEESDPLLNSKLNQIKIVNREVLNPITPILIERKETKIKTLVL
jgi:hypothetical protein